MRRDDWQVQFAEFVRKRYSMPFRWGANDCSLFAADLVLALTDQDFATWARSTYDDAMGAARLVEDRGGLASIATEALGDPIQPHMATVGDVVLLVNEGRQLLAVCNGLTAIGPGAQGMAVMDMQDALAAWRV